MKKIGIVSEYFYPHLGGITEHVYYFSRELIERGFEVVLLTGYEGEEDQVRVAIPKKLKIIRFGKTKAIFANDSYAKVTLGWNLGKKIKQVLADEKFDLLHIHSPITPVLPLLFQKYTNTVTVGTFHTYFDSLDSFFYYGTLKKTIQQYLDKLDGLIAVSNACIEALSRFYTVEATIIPNGVDTAWFSKPAQKIEKYSDGAPTIFFLGRLDPRNGLDALLDAFLIIRKEIKNVRLIIAGDGPMRYLYEKQAGDLRNKEIFFEGQINENRPSYFASSDVFCYPATKAAFSVTILEAMASGKPIVGSDNLGFRAAIQDGVNGLLAKPGDTQSLAAALIRLLTNKPLAHQIAQQGLESVKQYSWPAVTDRILNFYDKVYRQKKGVPFLS